MGKIESPRYFARRAENITASSIRTICALAGRRDLVSLAGGWPNAEAFPYDFTKRAIGRLMRERKGDALQYGMSEGLLPLREWLAGWMREREGIDASPDDVIITAGAQMGMDLACRVLVEEGDACLVDLPTYFGGVGSMRFYGGAVSGVPTDEGGTRMDEMEKILEGLRRGGKRVKLFYLQSLNHNPLGVSLSEDRRKRLLDLAREHDFLIMEDNPYGDLFYVGKPGRPVKSLDSEGRVVYIKSFAKIFSPGIRMAAVVADQRIIGKMVIARQFVDCCPANLNQHLLYEFCASGMMEKHIKKLRRFYSARMQRMLRLIEKYFPAGLRYTRPRGGLFIFVYLPEGMDAGEVFEEAMAQQVAFVPGGQFFVDGGGRNTMRLSFAQVEEERMEEAVSKIGGILRRRME